ncbi:plasmid fertility inhibition factor family protein [Thalassotalea euphylliae]|uniref:Uncharacterized protein n=1 Tax=Thalassotalea euphylliae TaxID=1655234 RepID=A0A3E0UHZ5_9GAMM|nr:hypothetical protein [Thalassotalea euphylliae]REL35382.1 hypothetical protein DXX92_08450 [Thalassotalea euphylliae]
MRIQSTQKEYKPTWVRAAVLEALWKVDRNFYIGIWSGEPKTSWFAYDIPFVKTAFCTADMYLTEVDGKLTVGFEDGRHRTRWLLNSGFELIPVGLEEHHYKRAVALGLAVSRVKQNEEMNA